jgi:hypothetical protein
MPALTRRQTLAGIAATGGVAAVGGGILWPQDHRGEVVRGILHRSFGKFRMDDGQFAALLEDIEEPFAPSHRRHAFYRAANALAPDRALALAPGRIGEEFDQYERRTVTAFMVRTDFLAIDPATQNVRYLGTDACTSPFARFT